MDSNYRFTAAEDQLLLALRDQGQYNADFIAQILGRGEWALKHRYQMLHNGLKSMNPRGKGKTEVHILRKVKKSEARYGWTPRKDYILENLYFEGHDWLYISERLAPYNAPECIDRWLRRNPQARYPFKTEIDFQWTARESNKLISMKKEGRTWGEMAKAFPWDDTQCRKHWYTNHWFVFIDWFPNGRNFRDRPQFWQQKVGRHPPDYKPQGQIVQNTAGSRYNDRNSGRFSDREMEKLYVKDWNERKVKPKADPNQNRNLGDTAGLNPKDAKGKTADEDVMEISEEQYKRGIAADALLSLSQQKPNANAIKPKDKPAPQKAKTSNRDAQRESEMNDGGEARYMLEQAEDERYRLIHPRHAAERQSYRFK